MDHGAPHQEADREHAGASATYQNFNDEADEP
jgi:hypothetical protein